MSSVSKTTSVMKGDVIIILGCLTNDDGSASPMMKSRLHKGAEIYRELKKKNAVAPHVILTGYQAEGQVITEARAMESYSLKHHLFEVQHIITEETASNTEENAYFCRILIDELDVSDVHVVTSQYHFKRASDIFAKVFPSVAYNVQFYCTTHDMSEAEAKRRTDRETEFANYVDENLRKIVQQKRSIDLKPVTVIRSSLIPHNVFLHGFTTRFGGVSTYKTLSSLNLYYTRKRKDPMINVEENRKRLAAACDFNLESFYLVKAHHGVAVWVVGDPEPENYDGIVTDKRSVTIAAAGADCMIILFCDPVKKICGAAHSGWAGTLAQMPSNVVVVMTHRFACDPGDIRAVIGPSIGPCHYEFGDDLADRFAEEISPDVVIRKRGAPRPFLDLRKCARLLLENVGVKPENIEDGSRCDGDGENSVDRVTHCTYCDPLQRFFSFRRDGSQFGTQIAFISIVG